MLIDITREDNRASITPLNNLVYSGLATRHYRGHLVDKQIFPRPPLCIDEYGGCFALKEANGPAIAIKVKESSTVSTDIIRDGEEVENNEPVITRHQTTPFARAHLYTRY